MFKLKERNSNIKTEVLAGLTTFLTLAYIIVVNPMILSDAGVPFDQAFTATIIAIIVGTLCMALLANYPIVIAPAMGLNAYFAYSVLGSSLPSSDFVCQVSSHSMNPTWLPLEASGIPVWHLHWLVWS